MAGGYLIRYLTQNVKKSRGALGKFRVLRMHEGDGNPPALIGGEVNTAKDWFPASRLSNVDYRMSAIFQCRMSNAIPSVVAPTEKFLPKTTRIWLSLVVA